MSWERLEEKFHGVAADTYPEGRRDEIVETVKTLERHDARDLTALL